MTKRPSVTALALSQSFRACIRSGRWKAGQTIPGRRDLAREFATSLATVERSAAALIAEGLLRVDGRRGTFVADANEVRSTLPAATQPQLPPGIAGTVGLVVDLLSYPSETLRREQWSARILGACENALADQPGISQAYVNLASDTAHAPTTRASIDRILAERIGTAIVIGESEALRQAAAMLMQAGIRTVGAACAAGDGLTPESCADDFASGVLAARHMQARGYDRLVFLRPFSSAWVETRLNGVRAAVAGGNLSVHPGTGPADPPPDGSGQTGAGMEAASALIRTSLRAGTGIIAPNDGVAAGFMQAAAGAGLVAGRDFGLLGFDDYERDAGITSLRPPLEQIGEEAAGVALRLLAGQLVPSRIAIPHRLIPRASSRPWQDPGARP